MPAFVDQTAYAQRQQCAGIGKRNRIFELLPRTSYLARFQIEKCAFALNPHPHRCILRAIAQCRLVIDVALRHRHHCMRGVAPTVAGDQEFAFDFCGHGIRDSAWGFVEAELLADDVNTSQSTERVLKSDSRTRVATAAIGRQRVRSCESPMPKPQSPPLEHRNAFHVGGMREHVHRASRDQREALLVDQVAGVARERAGWQLT